MKRSSECTYKRIISSADKFLLFHVEKTIATMSKEEQEEWADSDDAVEFMCRIYFYFIKSSKSLGTFLTRLNAIRTLDIHPKYFSKYEKELIKIRDEKGFVKVNSKRKLLKDLPDNWQEVVLSSMIINGNSYVGAVAVLMACGCRPIELSYGVKIKYLGDRFLMTIKSAKTLSLEERIIESNHPVLFKIFSTINELTVKASPKKLAEAIYNNSKKLPKGISPYVYRHAFSSNLKADGFDKEDIAKAMGHSVASSQRVYGYKLRGMSSHVISISATSELKVKNKSPSMEMSM